MKVLIFLICLMSIYSCKPGTTENIEEMARRSSRPEAVVVEAVVLETGVFYHELISNGKVFAAEKVIIPFRTPGTIVELKVGNGQRVRSGELMAAIEDFNYRTALARAQSRYDKALVDYTIDMTTSSKRTADSAEFNPEREKMMKYKSGLTDAELAVAEAKYNLNNTRIIAPISGRIANLEARLHNHSGPTFCTIINDDYMEVEFPIIESEYKFISINMPVSIVPFANDTITIEGKVKEINPIVAPNGMITVKASFRNTEGLIEGMNVKILIRKPEYNRLVVPKEALTMRDRKSVV